MKKFKIKEEYRVVMVSFFRSQEEFPVNEKRDLIYEQNKSSVFK